MTIEHTPAATDLLKDTSAGIPQDVRVKRAVRRLPVQRDWPIWLTVTVQIGILVGIVALWELCANYGVLDKFFWSQPSAIWKTLIIFFTEGDAWTDIGFTFRSTILGFIIGTTAGSLLGLSFWWSRNYAAVLQPYVLFLESVPNAPPPPPLILAFCLGGT